MAVRWYVMNPAEEEVEITEGVHEPLLVKTGAEEGSAEESQLVVEDPDSTYDFLAWRRVYALDDDAPANEQVIYMGSISNIWIERLHPFTATSRKFVLTLTDINYMLQPRVYDEDDFVRPEETDLQRLSALLGGSVIEHLDDNTDYHATTGGVPLDARDFVGQSPFDVLHDMAEASNRNFFVYYVEANGPPDFGTSTDELAIYYEDVGADLLESAISLSNLESDVDNATVFALADECRLHPDPQRIFSQLDADYDGGRVRVTDSAIATSYTRRDRTASFPNVTSATTATQRATRMLAEGATPAHRAEWAYFCGPGHVNALMAGMRFRLKATHWGGLTDGPDWTAFVDVRAMNRQVEQLGPAFYKVSGEAVPITTVAPTSCSTVLAAIEIQDSGQQAGSSPEGAEIPAAGADPRIVISAVCFANNGTAVGDTLTEAGAMTLVESFPSSPGYDHTLMGWAYSTSTAAITPVWTWNPSGRTNRWRQVSFEIPTAATSPEQAASQEGTGSTCTLAAPATAGNLLVVIRMFQPPWTSGFWDTPPTGFTLKGVYDVSDTGTEGQSIEVWTKCADGTEEVVHTGQAPYAHWAFLSEWALT